MDNIIEETLNKTEIKFT